MRIDSSIAQAYIESSVTVKAGSGWTDMGQ